MTPSPTPSPILLDCTLRDGSYAVNFQFTRRDTERLCRALESAGIEYIEVGHGLGLGASSGRYGISFESDEDYMKAASSTLKQAKWGVFFIPGIGQAEDIRKAVDLGVDFIRLGAEVENYDVMRPFAEQCREAGVMVCANLMKTYAVEPKQAGEVAQEIGKWGVVDCVYLVDSAGCMTPDDVKAYVAAMRENSPCDVGFHGHNNLDLANANCLVALDAGARYIDGSIRGMGRSAGNAQTEVLSFLLSRRPGVPPIDYFALFEAGETVIEPLNVQKQGLAPLDIVIGMARFHTSHLNRFRRVAERFSIDLQRLILAVSAVDCVSPPQELLERIARDLSRVEVS